MNEAAKREETIGQQVGAHLAPVTSPDDLMGDWEMRFGGPGGSDKVQWRYGFHPDGSVQISNEQWHWKFNDDGTLSLIASGDDEAEAQEDDESEELVYPFIADDGRVILTNDDSSLIEVLTKVSA